MPSGKASDVCLSADGQQFPIELCHGADPICNPADPNTWEDNWPAHLAGAYIDAGMANQAADFVAGRV